MASLLFKKRIDGYLSLPLKKIYAHLLVNREILYPPGGTARLRVMAGRPLLIQECDSFTPSAPGLRSIFYSLVISHLRGFGNFIHARHETIASAGEPLPRLTFASPKVAFPLKNISMDG